MNEKIEISKDAIEGITKALASWVKTEISTEVAMHVIWGAFREDLELNAKLINYTKKNLDAVSYLEQGLRNRDRGGIIL